MGNGSKHPMHPRNLGVLRLDERSLPSADAGKMFQVMNRGLSVREGEPDVSFSSCCE